MVFRLATLLLALTASLVSAQDLIHYKFETGDGDTVVNYAPPFPGVPRVGTIDTGTGITPGQVWGAGSFGQGGITLSNPPGIWNAYVVSGWDNVLPSPSSTMTVAFSYRVAFPIPMNNTATICSPRFGGAGLSLVARGDNGFISGSLANSSGGGQNLQLSQDVLTPAYSNWVHIALVLDVGRIVRWYVDGLPVSFQVIGGAPGWGFVNGSTNSPLAWGPAYFEYDEVRVALRPVPASEILEWATTDTAVSSRYGESCTPFGQLALLSSNQPVIGNAGHRLTVYAPFGALGSIGIGTNRLSYQGVPLPFDFGAVEPSLAGCQWHSSAELIMPLPALPPSGFLDLPLPLPVDPSLVSLVFYSQALLFNPANSNFLVTNALATSIGN